LALRGQGVGHGLDSAAVGRLGPLNPLQALLQVPHLDVLILPMAAQLQRLANPWNTM